MLGGVALAIATLCLMIGVRWQGEPLRPGALHRSHAQILEGKLASDRCAACHPAARGSLVDWFVSATDQHAGVSQSQLCMDCHHVKIDTQRALLAHNLTALELDKVRDNPTLTATTWHDRLPGPAFANGKVECSACHREHHGPDGSLSALTNHQCQTCHQDRFGSFAADHPDWNDWPYGRGGSIAFSHSTHANKHFATASQGNVVEKFDCVRCHATSPTGEIARAGNFESSCASCHQKPLRLEAEEGIELLALPALPQAPRSLDAWPIAATGFYDGRIGPLTALLISDRQEIRDALAALPPGYDFARLRPTDARQVLAAETVAVAVSELLDEVATGCEQAIERRLAASGVSSETAARVAAQLSPQLIADARARWFGRPPDFHSATLPDWPNLIQLVVDLDNPLRRSRSDRSPTGSASSPRPPRVAQLQPPPPLQEAADDVLLQPLLADDPLLDGDRSSDALHGGDGPAVTEERQPFDPATALPSGGWYRDDVRLAIRFRGAGHADPVLAALLDVATELGDTPAATALRESRAVAACAACHPQTEPGQPTSWLARRSGLERRGFTKFSHRPHLNLPSLADCTACHAVADPSRDLRLAANGPVSIGSSEPADFRPLARATCAACHTAKAAGDDCIKCHTYHVTAP